MTVTGHRAGEIRTLCAGLSGETRNRHIARLETAELSAAQISGLSVSGLDELMQNLSFVYTLTIAEWCRQIGDLWLLRLPWRNSISSSDLGGESEREVPFVVPNPETVCESFEIALPDGVIPYELPIKFNASCEWGRHSCSVTANGRLLTATREVCYFGGSVPPDRFGEWKRFRDAMIRADNTDVVLLGERSAAALAQHDDPAFRMFPSSSADAAGQ